MQSKPVALVTGANQGIGLQIAKDLTGHGFIVLVGSRNLERGEAAAREVGPAARALQLDVTDPASVAAAAARVRADFGRLDVLIQNAAIATTNTVHGQATKAYADTLNPSTVSLDEMRTVWDTNVFGVMRVYQAMVPLLRETPGSRIVNVSSLGGSLTVNSEPDFPFRWMFGPVYSASKTALNALTLAMSRELEADGIKVNAVSPGFTRTNLNGNTGTETLEEGAREAVRVALLGADGPTGQFTQWQGQPIPW